MLHARFLAACLAASLAFSATPLLAQEDDGPPSFTQIVRDFKELPGLFSFYERERDGAVLLELRPDQLNKIFLMSMTMEAGESLIFDSSSQLGSLPVYFKKVGNKVLLMVKNLNYRADANSAIAKAIPRGVSDSVLASAVIVAPPHPERGSLLVDASSLFITDVINAQHVFQMFQELGLGSGYRLDERNSHFDFIKSFPQNTEIQVELNYQGEGLDLPTPTLADSRSFLHKVHFSLTDMPQTSYKPRLHDDRVGHFTTMYWDYNQFLNEDPYVRFINRWNLEKADPALKLSPPKQPIVFWLENTIPVEYRDAVRDGVLVWNKAFEKLGFRDAVIVQQQPENADWDPADVRYNTIRWMVNPGAGYAVGPSHVHPLTGEIYDADVRISADFVRYIFSEYDELVAPLRGKPAHAAQKRLQDALQRLSHSCSYSSGLAREADVGRQILAARGQGLNGKALTDFVNEYITSLVAHEVGHTLGLRHNFKASTMLDFKDLNNEGLTRTEGLTGSVMDYTGINIAPKGQKQGEYYQTHLGRYDLWAIEYAYSQFPASSELSETAQLNQIASRSTQPELAYATDEDAYGGPMSVDPNAQFWDLGKDPLTYYRHRMNLGQELLDKMQQEFETPGTRYPKLRRIFGTALGEYFGSVTGISKHVGGIYLHRNHVGDPGAKPPLEVVPAARQREALKLLSEQILSAKAFNFSPELLTKLGPERMWDFEGSLFDMPQNMPIHQIVQYLQRRVVYQLTHPTLLARVQDNELLFGAKADKFTLDELFSTLRSTIWSELAANQNVSGYRRNLQRSHIERLKTLYLNDMGAPADARALARMDLTSLKTAMDTALKPGNKLDRPTQAHLEDSRAIIDATLKASMFRE